MASLLRLLCGSVLVAFLLSACDSPPSPSPAPESPPPTATGQQFDLRLEPLAVQAGAPGMMRLAGEIETGDAVDLTQVRQLVRIDLRGQVAEPAWSRVSDRHYRFVLENIARSNQPGDLRVAWDGATLGSSEKGARDLKIPALTAFEVTGVRVEHRPDTFIQVNFSAPLNRQQNLEGLITLDDAAPRLRLDGSVLRIYPPRVTDEPVTLQISGLVQSAAGTALDEDFQQSLVLSLVLPGVSFVGREASILPRAKRLSVPFEAQGVDSVQVIAFKVYENNIGQYLQRSRLHASYADTSVGRYLWRKVYPLPEAQRGNKQRFSLDLTELMAEHPEGLVRIELRLDRSNALIDCPDARPQTPVGAEPGNYDGEDDYGRRNPDWYERYYRDAGYYNYSERNNPCKDAYYFYGDKHLSSRTFMVSDIGLLAKRGQDNRLLVVATRLEDAKPLPGSRVKVYNYQQQLIGQGTTDNYGMLELATEGTPFYLVAEHQQSRAYLRVPRNEALPVNAFDVSGEHVRDGLKGFIYGERDVWRPGDDIHLTFILQDRDGHIPPGHPVRLDFFDPQGVKQASVTQVTPVNDFYTFQLKTAEDAPTGNWRAVVHLGNRYFDKIIKVETITPNRLRLELTAESQPLLAADMPLPMTLSAQWLHGASAAGLKADSQLRLLRRETRFEGFGQYVFDDPARSLDTSPRPVFEGNLDAEGKAGFNLQLELAEPPPGMLTALFTNRVFEGGGDFSTNLRSFEFHPFSHWVGLQVPKGDGYYDAIARDRDHPVNLQTLGPDGKPVAGRELEISVYALEWRWWWDQSGEDLASYAAGEQHRPVANARLTSDAQGRASWQLDKDTYQWGRHLVRVCDLESRHCAGQLVYLGWSWGQQAQAETATQLMLTSDRDSYQVGDTARVRLPQATQGRALLSLENGSRILERRWLDIAAGETEIDIPITAAMAPNIYVHLTLLLPHQQRDSEAPMRLYGIVPLRVEDPATRLAPKLEAPEQVRPEQPFTLSVSETRGRPMTYTLALVDEGLLGITGFKVPDAHSHFYRREALGVNTWDLFDQVVGAYGASLERVLAIGGSDAADEAERQRRERRFPPVVKFLGAFSLSPGETRRHDVTLPPYLGAVRVMLVAGDASGVPAYGQVEASITVTQPLVLLATLPRVLGPGEEVDLPVNVFVSDPALKTVQLSLETNDLLTPLTAEATLAFDQPGDAIGRLKIRVNDALGKARVKVTARSGAETASQEIFIDSRAPNPPSVIREVHTLAPGETWQSSLQPHGLAGTNTTSLEVSSLPPLNLAERLEYLVTYPHGCLEQVTSSAFPQLYLGKLVELDESRQSAIDDHIRAAIDRLRGMQQGNGGFRYWPGGNFVNDWAASYAGHFLVEARRAGYAVPASLLDNWVAYQRDLARRSATDTLHDSQSLVAAYRLYTLALADQPELPAMNRLRERLRSNPGQSASARWLLSLAYQHLGLKEVADELLGPVSPALLDAVQHYEDPGYTYGSQLRDTSLLLLTLVKAGALDAELSWQVAERIADDLSSETWFSTQTTAWALLAMGEFASGRGSAQPMVFALQEGEGAWQSLQSGFSLYRQHLDDPRVKVRNEGTQSLRLLLSNRGVAPDSVDESSAEGLKMDVQFYDMNDQPLDVRRLPQGTDFMAEVTISADFARLPGRGIQDIAATLVIPGGWQIRNERLEGQEPPKGVDYLDIRDDRLLAYFSLWRDQPWRWRYTDSQQTSVTLRLTLNASYTGRFYLPAWQVNAMYNGAVHARIQGRWVEVQ